LSWDDQWMACYRPQNSRAAAGFSPCQFRGRSYSGERVGCRDKRRIQRFSSGFLRRKGALLHVST
jgi:hypothetical protein